MIKIFLIQYSLNFTIKLTLKGVTVMQILKLLVFISVLYSQLFSSPLDEKRIIVSKVDNDTYKMKIFFNYENPYQTQITLRGRMAHHFVTIPMPDRFDVKSVTAEIKYTPSLVLYHARSVISIIANDNIIRQFALNEQRYKDSGKIRVRSDIPTNILDDYNKIGVQIVQHYTKGSNEAAEDTSAPELWSQIDLQNSFIEIKFKLKDFEEKISSIEKFMFDNKNIIKDSVNFVFPKMPTDDDFYNYTFMANLVGEILKFRDMDFSVSTKIIKSKNNVIIMPRKDLNNTFKEYMYLIKDFDKKISGNINVIQNPKRSDKGILVITGNSQQEIKNSLYRIVNKDILLFEEQRLDVFNVEIPPPSKPFSTPGFISTGETIPFSDLGYKTKTFFGESSVPLSLNFKVYPTVSFNKNDSIMSTLNIIQGGVIRSDSTANVSLNDILAYQIRITNSEDRVSASSTQRFEIADKHIIPTALLSKGKNNLKISFTMIPVGGPALLRFNNDILKLTLRDDSIISFPKGKTQIELPSLKYAADLAFPFSIYPDLRNTAILITDFDSRTIASAMYVSFYLGKMVDYPAYRLTVTPDINKIINKDIISIGSQVERYALLYQNAPIRFTKDGVVKEIALNSKYKDISGSERIKYHTATTKMTESLNFKDYLIAQAYQSPFNKRRTVLEFSAHNPATLIKGVRNGFTPIHMGGFNGDTWLYNTKTDKSFSFRLKESYVLDKIVDIEDNNISKDFDLGQD